MPKLPLRPSHDGFAGVLVGVPELVIVPATFSSTLANSEGWSSEEKSRCEGWTPEHGGGMFVEYSGIGG